MEKLELHIPEVKGKSEAKVYTAEMPKLTVGFTRRLMSLIKIDGAESTADIARSIMNAWENCAMILSEAFPDVTDDEWDLVDIEEVIQIIVQIARSSMAKAMTIPAEKKTKN